MGIIFGTQRQGDAFGELLANGHASADSTVSRQALVAGVIGRKFIGIKLGEGDYLGFWIESGLAWVGLK